ncbi:hypothetical protein GCM10020000_76440 [Streptomyces olivoverticillatus]
MPETISRSGGQAAGLEPQRGLVGHEGAEAVPVEGEGAVQQRQRRLAQGVGEPVEVVGEGFADPVGVPGVLDGVQFDPVGQERMPVLVGRGGAAAVREAEQAYGRGGPGGSGSGTSRWWPRRCSCGDAFPFQCGDGVEDAVDAGQVVLLDQRCRVGDVEAGDAADGGLRGGRSSVR